MVNSEFWIFFSLNVALREKEHLTCFARFSFLEGSVCIKRYILVCSEVARLSVTRPQCLFLSLFHLCIRERVVGETVAGLWRLVLTGYTCLLKAPQCVRCEARSLAPLCSPHWQCCNSESPWVLLSNSASGTTASHRKDTVLVMWKKYLVCIIALMRGGFFYVFENELNSGSHWPFWFKITKKKHLDERFILRSLGKNNCPQYAINTDDSGLECIDVRKCQHEMNEGLLRSPL